MSRSHHSYAELWRHSLAGRLGSVLVLVAVVGMFWASSRSSLTSGQQVSPKTEAAAAGAPARLDETARLIFEKVNALRSGRELPALADNDSLGRAASQLARFMAGTEKFAHGADGRLPRDRALEAGYEPCVVAENIGWQFSSQGLSPGQVAQGIVAGWERSAGHRGNMLDVDLTEAGVAVTHSPQTGRYYAVIVFGRPKSQALRVTVSNQSPVDVEYELASNRFPLRSMSSRTHVLCRSTELVVRRSATQDESSSTTVDGSGNIAISQDAQGELHVRRTEALR